MCTLSVYIQEANLFTWADGNTPNCILHFAAFQTSVKNSGLQLHFTFEFLHMGYFLLLRDFHVHFRIAATLEEISDLIWRTTICNLSVPFTTVTNHCHKSVFICCLCFSIKTSLYFLRCTWWSIVMTPTATRGLCHLNVNIMLFWCTCWSVWFCNLSWEDCLSIGWPRTIAYDDPIRWLPASAVTAEWSQM